MAIRDNIAGQKTSIYIPELKMSGHMSSYGTPVTSDITFQASE